MCNDQLGDYQQYGPDQIRIYTQRGWVIIDSDDLQEELNKIKVLEKQVWKKH